MGQALADCNAGAVRAADQGAAYDMGKAHIFGQLAVVIKFFRRDIFGDWNMVRRRLQILANGQYCYTGLPEIGKGFFQILQGFAEADHDAAFDEHVGMARSGIAQYIQGLLIVADRADFREEAAHGLDVVIEDGRVGIEDDVHGRQAAFKVGRQNFDGRVRADFSDFFNAGCKLFGSAVLQVIARNRRNDNVLQPQVRRRFSQVFWFHWVQRFRFALGDGAVAAGPRADAAQDQEGRRLVAEAFANIRAVCTFADCVELQPFDEIADVLIRFVVADMLFKPGWLFGCLFFHRGHPSSL